MNAPPPYGQQQPQYPPQGYPPPQQPHAPPPQKKGMSGCVIAALVVGGLFLVGALGFAFFIWRFASSEEGKKIVSAVSSGAQIAAEAQTAPGTNELRALGCVQAMVLDTEKIEALASQFGDAGVHTATGARFLVSCQVARTASAPSCDQVATTYVTAVGRAAGEFEVNVAQQGNGKEHCAAMYQPDGSKVKGR